LTEEGDAARGERASRDRERERERERAVEVGRNKREHIYQCSDSVRKGKREELRIDAASGILINTAGGAHVGPSAVLRGAMNTLIQRRAKKQRIIHGC
jgi:hypothetical protein